MFVFSVYFWEGWCNLSLGSFVYFGWVSEVCIGSVVVESLASSMPCRSRVSATSLPFIPMCEQTFWIEIWALASCAN